MAKIGNDKTNVSSTFDQDIELLQEEWGVASMIQSWWNDLKWVVEAWKGWLTNKYDVYTNDDIKDWASYSELQNLVNERENEQYQISSDTWLSSEERDFRLWELVQQYKNKEDTLLNQAMHGEDKRSKFDKARSTAYDWAGELTKPEEVASRVSQEADNIINDMDKILTDQWLVDNETLSYKWKLKTVLKKELAHLEVNKRKAVADLKSKWAANIAVKNTLKDYNEIIALQTLISRHSLEAANNGILDWDHLTDYVIQKIWTTRMNRAIELKNQMNIDLQARQAKANIQAGNYWVWLIEFTWVGWALIAKYWKKVLWVAKTDIERFKWDYSGIQLSDESWLSYIMDYTVDNFDDIVANLIGGGISWWALWKWIYVVAKYGSKVTRLQKLLYNTATGKKIADGKLLKGGKYFKDQVMLGLWANQTINIAMNDVNSEERMVSDAIIDLALWPIFDWVLTSMWYISWQASKTVMNSKLMEEFVMTESKIINEFKLQWLDENEARKLFVSAQDYLRQTDGKFSNKEIFNFIRTNKERLETEWSLVWNWMVLSLRNYQEKSYNPIDVDVTLHNEVLRKEWQIDLTENTLAAIDIKHVFKKVNTMYVGKNAESTIKSLLSWMRWIDKATTTAFLKENTDMVQMIHDAIISAKEKVKDVESNIILTLDNSPLAKIEELSTVFDTLITKLSKDSTLINIYRPTTWKNWEEVFENIQVKKNDLIIDGYQVFSRTNEDEPVFISTTLKSKIKLHQYNIETSTYNLLTKGFSPKINDIDKALEELQSIMWYKIELWGEWAIKLVQEDWIYRIRFKDSNKIAKRFSLDKMTYNGKELQISKSNIDTIILNILLNKNDAFKNSTDFSDAYSATILRLTDEIVWEANIKNDYREVSARDAAIIATKNVDNMVKDLFDPYELRSFNTLMKNSILSNSSLTKLTTLSWMWKKDIATSMWTMVESLMLRAAERFSKPEIQKLIAKVNDNKDIYLSKTNRKDAINNLLLGENPTDAFNHVDRKSSWHISKHNAKLLGEEPTSAIFNITEKQSKEFIEDIVARKKKLWISEDELKEVRYWLETMINDNADLAVQVYTDRVIRSAMNDKWFNEQLHNLEVQKWLEDEIDFSIQMKELVESETDITIVVKWVNDIMNDVPKKISETQFKKLNDIIRVVKTRVDESKWSKTDHIAFIVSNIWKLSAIINNGIKIDMESIGSSYPYISQTTGWDNILKKSFNYILNPYEDAQIKDIWVAKVIDDYITEHILSTDEFWDAYIWDSIFVLWDEASKIKWSSVDYQEKINPIIEKLRKFVYPESDWFNINQKAIDRRDEIIDNLRITVANHISNDPNISIYKKDWIIAKGYEKWEIVISQLTNWSILNTLQQRLKKKSFDGYKINFNKKKHNAPTKIEWIEEYRTMFTHFYNAWKIPSNIKPLILEGNSWSQWMSWYKRENYRLATNLVWWINVNWDYFQKNQEVAKAQLKKYINSTVEDPKEAGKIMFAVWKKAEYMTQSNEYVDGFINLMNIWDKDSFWAYTKTFTKEIDGKKIKDFQEFMKVNDKQFTDDMIEELNMKDIKDKKTWKLDLVKIWKRIATLSAEAETLFPWSKIPIRNYILEEPEYIDTILQAHEWITKDSLFIEEFKDWKRIYKTLNTTWQDFIFNNFQKELNWFKDWFSKTDFTTFNEAIVTLLTTANSDGASFLHPDQIKFYSNYQSHIDKEGRFPIKMHHYSQEEEWSVLYKTNFNSYTDDMKRQLQDIVWDSYDFSSTRLIWDQSEKLKTYWDEWFVEMKDTYIMINWIKTKIKWYVDTDTSFDKHASTEAETQAEANGITKQADTRTHPVGSEFILRTKQALIEQTIEDIKTTFNINKKLDAKMFNKFEDFANYVLNQTNIKWSSLKTVNQSLKDKLQKLKNLIEKPKDEWLGFRWVMQPRINILNEDWIYKLIADDELAVSKKRFEQMKSKMMKVDKDYYVSIYRTPVPNTENMTINKVVIDYSMRSEEDVAIGAWNVFINKQGDFDGDHLNIVYINNQEYLGDSKWIGKNFGWLWITLGAIFNIEDWRKEIVKPERLKANLELQAKIYQSKHWIELQEEITKFIHDWIKEQWDQGIIQTRVPIEQVDKDIITSDFSDEFIKKNANERIDILFKDEEFTRNLPWTKAKEIKSSFKTTLRKMFHKTENAKEFKASLKVFDIKEQMKFVWPTLEFVKNISQWNITTSKLQTLWENRTIVIDNTLLEIEALQRMRDSSMQMHTKSTGKIQQAAFERIQEWNAQIASYERTLKILKNKTEFNKKIKYINRAIELKNKWVEEYSPAHKALAKRMILWKSKTDSMRIQWEEFEEAKATTLTKASSNAMTGKDGISQVDSFIRTLDLVRKYAWEYNNAEWIGKTKEEVMDNYREWLSFIINQQKESLKIMTEWSKEHTDVLLLIESNEKVVNDMVLSLGQTTDNLAYKPKAGLLEQATLDLAKIGKDKLDEGWENDLLDIVYPWIDPEALMVFLWPVQISTGKVYKGLWEKDILTYWKEWSLDWYIDVSLPLFWQHKVLYDDLTREIQDVYENLSSIKTIHADKAFFWFHNKETYYNQTKKTLLPFQTKDSMHQLIANPSEEVIWNIVDWYFTYLPWLTKLWDKSIWKKGWFALLVEDAAILDAYLKKHKLTNIWIKDWIIQWDKWRALLNTWLLKNRFPWVTSTYKNKINYHKVLPKDLETFKKATKEYSKEWQQVYSNWMTSKIYAEILWNKNNTATISKPKWFFKAKWFQTKEINKGKQLEITFNEKDNKNDIITEMLDDLEIDPKQRNSILLHNNLEIDYEYLTPAQRLELMYTHYILRDAGLKDIYKDSDAIAERVRWNLVNLIKDTWGENLSIDKQNELVALQDNLWLEVGSIKELGGEYIVFTDKELQPVNEVDWINYNVDTQGSLNGKQWYVIYKSKDTPLYKTNDEDVKAILKDLLIPWQRREYDLIKKVWLNTNDLKYVSDTMDWFLDNVWEFNTALMSTRTMKVFKNLMIRNQDLKNNATYDLYEEFTVVQNQFNSMDKARRRQIDNHIFMNIYKGKNHLDEKEISIYSQDYSDKDKQYYNDMYAFVKGYNNRKQSVEDIMIDNQIDLTKTIRTEDWSVADINSRITSSLIEDIVNLRHKTEKIAFYEVGIYNQSTFNKAYDENIKKYKLDMDKSDRQNIYDIIFEYDYIKNKILHESIKLMRTTTFSTTLGATSWLTGAAWFTMWLMQIPSELLRLWSFSKHKYPAEDLVNIMDNYKILKSTWIEAGIHFWPIEAKPQFTHWVTYKALKRVGIDKFLNFFSMKLIDWEKAIKNISALIANPLIITDLVVDWARKRTAFWNVIHMLWYKSTEDFASKLDLMPATEQKDLLNRIRLGSELKYHELSGWVTAGSYLFRETTFARHKWMIHFNYLMNWALHLQSTTLGSAKQTIAWMGEIYNGNWTKGLQMIKDSNMFARIFWQSIVVAWLYAKLNSHDEYEWEFRTKKDLWEFTKTLNSNILSLEMFVPIKAMEKAYEQEGGIVAKVASWLSWITWSAYRELDLIGIVWEELYTSFQTPGYNTWEAITTALVSKGSKWLAFNKMIEVENNFPEFSRRAQIDQMFWADNPNFDESLYKLLYSESKGDRLDWMWKAGNPHLILWEIWRAMPIIRHLSNMNDGWTSYTFFDKQVREINKKLTSGVYDEFYKKPELLLGSIYEDWDIDKLWTYSTNFTASWKDIWILDKNLVHTELSKFIPEIKYNLYGQLTENIMVGEMINKLWVEWYVSAIGTWSRNNQYVKQLLTKIKQKSPAKLPYVLGILLQSEMKDIEYKFKKAKIDIMDDTTEAIKYQLLLKYKDLIKWSNPMIAQMLGYRIVNDNSELKDIMLSDSGYLSETIADRIATRIMMTEAYEKWSNHASYIGWRFGTLTNRISKAFAEWNIDEGHFKASLLDLYRLAADEIHEWNFTPDQKLEMKTAIYKSLGEHVYVLYEDPSLGESYEAARINLAHKLYKHTSTLEQYARDAQIKWTKWDITNPNVGNWEAYKNAYRNTNLIKKYSSWGWSRSYGNWYVQWAANNIQKMLGNPRTNFSKIFKPTYNPYTWTKHTPFGFKFTIDDERTFIEYFRSQATSKYSRDLFEKKSYASKWKVFRTSRRKAELTKQDIKNIGRQEFRWFLSKGLMRWLAGSKE